VKFPTGGESPRLTLGWTDPVKFRDGTVRMERTVAHALGGTPGALIRALPTLPGDRRTSFDSAVSPTRNSELN
jgi:hypothetical protein